MVERVMLVGLLISFVSLASAQDVMSCMFCEVITEELGNDSTATGTIQGMFRRCSKMGLVEPVCDQFVTEYAKRIFFLARSGVPAAAICAKLNLCGFRR